MCTTVIAGRMSTANNVLMVARDEDFEQNNWNKYIKGLRQPQYVSDKCYEEGMWRLGNGLCIPIPENAYPYCGIADAEGCMEASCNIGDYHYFEERGVNENNVAITATNSMGINRKALEADPVVTPGIEEAVILTMILPQASTARQTVQLLGGYVERYGASEANGITIADVKEVWYMEIGSGHHWIAVRVPENKYLVVSNCMRIRGVDLTDTNHVMGSSGLFQFVKEHELLSCPDEKNFDFATAFGYAGKSGEPNNDPYYNVDRIWLAQKILSPSQEQDIRQTVYPLFMEPDEKITIQKVAQVLRAGYEGTKLEGISTRPIGVVRTAESHIMVHDRTMPEPLQWVIWQTLGTPLGAPYMPIFAITKHIPEQYASGNSEYDESSAYWKFRGLFSLADRMGEDTKQEVVQMWQQYEEQLFYEHGRFTNMIKSSMHELGDEAEKIAENYSIDILLRTAQTATDKRKELLTKIAIEQKE